MASNQPVHGHPNVHTTHQQVQVGMHQGHSAPQNQPQQQQPNVIDTDPLVKYQNLLPILKESINNLIKHTVHILQNTASGQCRQSDIQLLNKCMEDFTNISDQVYHWLALADSSVSQYIMGTKFSTNTALNMGLGLSMPTPQQQQQNQQPPTTPDTSHDTLFYSQYLSNAKRHVTATNELRNMLQNFADGLGKDDSG